MTARATSQSTSSSHAHMADSAALIINFYGKRGQLQSLIAHLIQELAVTPQGPQVPDNYVNATNGTLLRYFDVYDAYDAAIIQIALNMPGEVKAAWAAMHKQMVTVLSHDEFLKNIWGYTLIYQADLAPNISSDVAFPALVAAAQPLYHGWSEHPQILAQSNMSGGELWLLAIPDRGDGLQAATMYVALSQPDTKNRFVVDVLYNPGAAFLMADLVAHKGYHQMRQYRLGDLGERYRHNMETLSKHTDTLLHTLSQVAVTDKQLDDLAHEYGLLVSAVVHLDQLHLSLMRQEFNFNWWCKQAGGGDIAEFHHTHLEYAVRELELLVSGGQHPLEAASTAIEMLRTRLDKQRETQQQRVETILTIAAVVFSILVLIDKDTARSLLEFMNVSSPIGIWPILGVQVSVVLIFSLLIMLAIKLIKRTRQSR